MTDRPQEEKDRNHSPLAYIRATSQSCRSARQPESNPKLPTPERYIQGWEIQRNRKKMQSAVFPSHHRNYPTHSHLSVGQILRGDVERYRRCVWIYWRGLKVTDEEIAAKAGAYQRPAIGEVEPRKLKLHHRHCRYFVQSKAALPA
jgi:hypothetical protein